MITMLIELEKLSPKKVWAGAGSIRPWTKNMGVYSRRKEWTL